MKKPKKVSIYLRDIDPGLWEKILRVTKGNITLKTKTSKVLFLLQEAVDRRISLMNREFRVQEFREQELRGLKGGQNEKTKE